MIKLQHFFDQQYIILSSLFWLRYNPVREAEENLMPTTEDIWKLLHDKILNSFSSVKQAFLVFDDVSVTSETGVWWTWPYRKDFLAHPPSSLLCNLHTILLCIPFTEMWFLLCTNRGQNLEKIFLFCTKLPSTNLGYWSSWFNIHRLFVLFLFRTKMGVSLNVTSDVCWKVFVFGWVTSNSMSWWPRLIRITRDMSLIWISWTNLNKEKQRFARICCICLSVKELLHGEMQL